MRAQRAHAKNVLRWHGTKLGQVRANPLLFIVKERTGHILQRDEGGDDGRGLAVARVRVCGLARRPAV